MMGSEGWAREGEEAGGMMTENANCLSSAAMTSAVPDAQFAGHQCREPPASHMPPALGFLGSYFCHSLLVEA